VWCSRVGLGSVGVVIFTPSFVRGMKTPSLYQRNKGNKMSQSNFDFNAFSSLVEHKPAGLQIFLAQQLLSNALWSMTKYDNPRTEEVNNIFNEVKALRAKLKADALARA
jgi:hypothetical protein